MQQVEIRVGGKLDQEWAEWLDGFTFTHTAEDETCLTGPIQDQAALYGLIAKLRDLGVKLIAIRYGTETPRGNSNSVEQEWNNTIP